MLKYFAILLGCLSMMHAHAQPLYKFDFGGGKTAPGFTKVSGEDVYDVKRGFGFVAGNLPVDKNNGGDALKGDYVTSDKPFYFSVKLPDGNYDITLYLGDTKGISATTVRVECRRLMLENLRTKKGEIATKKITVHVKDSLIRNAAGDVITKVKLKPREREYLHWDDVLTLEFNDSMPKVCGLEIARNNRAVTLFLAGNSTVVDQSREPWAAWGQMFPRFMVPGLAAVANYAESGETLKAFAGERRLEKILSLGKPGDYLFIEFTHNDQKPGGNYLEPFTTYKQTVKSWIDQARAKQMLPVLVTSMHRRRFNANGTIENTLGDYPDALRQLAAEEKVYLVDLNAMSKKLYEAWGPELSLKAFVHYPANSFPGQADALADNTHFSPYGAYELAKCVAESIRNQRLPLAKFLTPDFKGYNPAHFLTYDSFYWPQSSFVNVVKPDGN